MIIIIILNYYIIIMWQKYIQALINNMITYPIKPDIEQGKVDQEFVDQYSKTVKHSLKEVIIHKLIW